MKIACFLLGHNVVQTGRASYALREWLCLRCRKRLISHDQAGYCGFLFPRAKYEGMTFTVFSADVISDEIVSFNEKC